MKPFLYFAFLFLFTSHQLIAQEQLLCPWISSSFKIENEADILIKTTNSDGTLTLTHPTNQDITDIFIDYEIYVFERNFPSSQSEELVKSYTLGASSKQLFIDLSNNVSEETYSSFEPTRIDTPINDDFITLVNGREFRLSGSISFTDLDSCNDDCPPIPVSEELNIIVGFTYDPVKELLTVATTEETACGNSFSINLSGGIDFGNGTSFDDFNIQTWSVNSGTSSLIDNNEACFEVERLLYIILNINCFRFDFDSPNFKITNINPDGVFQLAKPNLFFGEDRIEFRDVLLSVPENTLEDIYVYQIKDNPYLQVHNPNSETLSIQIYDITGKKVIRTTKTSSNVMISNLASNSIYLAKLQNSQGFSKTVKFIKR